MLAAPRDVEVDDGECARLIVPEEERTASAPAAPLTVQALPAPDLAIDCVADKAGAVLAVGQHGGDPVKHFRRQADGNLRPDSRASPRGVINIFHDF